MLSVMPTPPRGLILRNAHSRRFKVCTKAKRPSPECQPALRYATQRTQEGAWAKRMHPGLMAAAAITAASLAREGFSGPKQAYEGKYGLYSCFIGEYAAGVNLAAITDSLGSRWECTRTSIKLYP